MARMNECITPGCTIDAYPGTPWCILHGGLGTNRPDYESRYRKYFEAVKERMKPRSEWWSPSEHCDHESFLRLARIDSAERSNDSNTYVVIYYGGEFRNYRYDTAEHRDEDFERLRNALGVE